VAVRFDAETNRVEKRTILIMETDPVFEIVGRENGVISLDAVGESIAVIRP
jgi:hypothetical protein